MNLDQWLFYDENYSALGGTDWWAGGVRLALIIVGLAMKRQILVVDDFQATFAPIISEKFQGLALAGTF